jgi:restriction endonuclease S subunit
LKWDDYLSLLQRKPSKSVQKHELYKEYEAKIKVKDANDLLDRILALEKEKIFYFLLARPQKTVVVKSGSKDDEKRFLGYEFSFRRGSEGIHPIQRGQMIDQCTKLFDPAIETFENPEKASTYIYRAFIDPDAELKVPENLKNHVFKMNLVDMLTFDRVTVETKISLAVKKKVQIKSKWNLRRFKDVATVEYGCRIVKGVESGQAFPVYGGGGATFFADKYNRENAYVISRFGMSPECVRFVADKFFLNDSGMTVVANDGILQSYLDYYLLLNQELIYECGRGLAQKNIDMEMFDSIRIPVPPLDVQAKIVKESEALEKTEAEAKTQKEKLSNQTERIIETLDFATVELGNIVSLKNGLNYDRQSLGDIVNIIGVGDFQNNIVPNLNSIEQIQIDGQLTEDYVLKPDDLLVVRSNGSANLVGRFLLIDKILPNTSFSGFTIRLRPDGEKVHSKYLCYYLRTETVREKLTKNSGGSNIKSINQTLLSSLTIPLPSLAEQQKIVAKIEKLENEIADLQKESVTFSERKNAVLRKWL